jgi:hypothetical protein
MYLVYNVDGNNFGKKNNFYKNGGDFRKPNFDNNDRKFNSHNDGFKNYRKDNDFGGYNRTQEGFGNNGGYNSKVTFEKFPRSTYDN